MELNVDAPVTTVPVEAMECDSSSIIDPDVAEAFKKDGNEAYKAKDYVKAKELYSKAIEHDPNSPIYYSNRAMALICLECYPAALEDSLQAIRLNEKFVKGYLRAGCCYLALGNPQQAISSLNKALEFEKKNSDALTKREQATHLLKSMEMAVSMFDKGDFRSALYYWNRCLESSPSCVNYKVKKAETLVMLQKYNESSVLCNEVLMKDQQNADAIYVKGLTFYYQDMSERATKFFHQVLRLNPDHRPSQKIIRKSKQLVAKKEEGNLAFKSGQYEQALELYTEGLSIDEYNRITNAKLHCNRALVELKMGRLEEAISDCTKAIQLDEQYIRAYQRRAKCYQDNNQHEEAVRDLERVCQMDRSRENNEALKEGKRLLKLSKRKDYYKILGVSRTAADDEIKKAYKKKALQFHPDRHSGGTEEDRKQAEISFKEVGEAYSVLSDRSKRTRYDNGQDLDEMGGMGDFDPNQIFQTFFSGGGPFSFGTGGGGGNPFSFSFNF